MMCLATIFLWTDFPRFLGRGSRRWVSLPWLLRAAGSARCCSVCFGPTLEKMSGEPAELLLATMIDAGWLCTAVLAGGAGLLAEELVGAAVVVAAGVAPGGAGLGSLLTLGPAPCEGGGPGGGATKGPGDATETVVSGFTSFCVAMWVLVCDGRATLALMGR